MPRACAAPHTESHRKRRLGRKPVPSSLLPSSDGAGQWAGPEDVSLLGEQERRGLAGRGRGSDCPDLWGGGGTGRSRRAQPNSNLRSGQGAGRVEAEGKPRFLPTHPSFFSAFLSNTTPFRKGPEGEEEPGPRVCELSFWLPQTAGCVGALQATEWGQGGGE